MRANVSGAFARFEDPAYSVRSFIELIRYYQDRHNARSAAASPAMASTPSCFLMVP